MKIVFSTLSFVFYVSDTAEPRGRVCTPDCKLKCYSYCDKYCCGNANALLKKRTYTNPRHHQQQQQQQHSSLGDIPAGRSTICRDLDLACLLNSQPRFVDPPPAENRPPPPPAVRKYPGVAAAQRRSNTCSGPQCLVKYALNPPARLPNIKQCRGDVRCETRILSIKKNDVGKPRAVPGHLDTLPDFFQNMDTHRTSFMVQDVPDTTETHFVRPVKSDVRKLFTVVGPSVGARRNKIGGRGFSPLAPRVRSLMIAPGSVSPFTRQLQEARRQQQLGNNYFAEGPKMSFTLNND